MPVLMTSMAHSLPLYSVISRFSARLTESWESWDLSAISDTFTGEDEENSTASTTRSGSTSDHRFYLRGRHTCRSGLLDRSDIPR